MSLDLEARLRVFLASAPQTIHAVRTLEASITSNAVSFMPRSISHCASGFNRGRVAGLS